MKLELNDVYSKLKNSKSNYIEYYEGSKRKKKLFSEVYNDVMEVVASFREYHFEKGTRVIIYAKTSYQWVLFDLACVFCGVYTIPLDVNRKFEKDEILEFYQADYIVSDDETMLDGDNDKTISLDELLSKKGSSSDFQPVKYDDEDIFTTTFTSGTLGRSKSIEVKTKYFNDQFTNAYELFDITEKDKILIFLPLNIYLERCYIYLAILTGFNVLLSPLSQALKALQKGEVTFTVGVPYFFEQLHDLFMLQVKSNMKLKLSYISFIVRKKMFPSLMKGKVYRQFQNFYGGKLRFLLTGSAKCKDNIIRFYDTIGIPLYEGYGLSEIANMVALNSPGNMRIGSVGKAYPNKEIRFDEDNQILVRADKVPVRGYINESEETNAAVYLKDGWVATGDIGYMDEDGFVYINGRKNDMIALANGKKVYPAYIENMINDYNFIDNSIVIGGDNKSYLVALIAVKCPISDEDLNQHMKAVNEKLTPDEQIKKFKVVDEKFTPQNGLMTPAFKLNRSFIQTHFKKEIDAMYK